MLPMSIHIITADIEEEEEGGQGFTNPSPSPSGF